MHNQFNPCKRCLMNVAVSKIANGILSEQGAETPFVVLALSACFEVRISLLVFFLSFFLFCCQPTRHRLFSGEMSWIFGSCLLLFNAMSLKQFDNDVSISAIDCFFTILLILLMCFGFCCCGCKFMYLLF